MTILDANKEIERIDNEIELLLNKKQMILDSVTYPKPSLGERVQGGGRTDKYKQLDYAIDTIDPQLEYLYEEKKMYEAYIERELIRLGKYNEVEKLIVFYKEQTTTQYTWIEISQKTHYSITQCRRIYRKWKKERNEE